MILQAVIFDMDGVLTDTVELHYQSWKRVCDGAGIPFERQDNEKLLGLTRQRSLEVILDGRPIPEKQKQELLSQKNSCFQNLIMKMTSADLQPGVMDLLQALRACRIRIAVASGSRNVRLILKRLGIENYFDVLNDGNSVQRSKPAPDIFLRTAEMLQVKPKECIVVEDSSAGIQAALAAEMCVIGIGPHHRVGKAHAIYPDVSSTNLKELLALHEMTIYDRICSD